MDLLIPLDLTGHFEISKKFRNVGGLFEGDKPPSRVTAEQSACPARERAPFCVFHTGRWDCAVPEGRRDSMENLATEGS